MTPITDEEIRALRDEAKRDQDWEFAADCDAALAGDRECREHCAKVLHVYGIQENH